MHMGSEETITKRSPPSLLPSLFVCLHSTVVIQQ